MSKLKLSEAVNRAFILHMQPPELRLSGVSLTSRKQAIYCFSSVMCELGLGVQCITIIF